ncbi:transcription factor HES-2 isoform X2 [Vicugna pacos]|uniref:Transcription factor HES-2 isoform X2 n=1 Tax=Vicugna pacos TaxID=30538 RepID=A0ABM5EFP5_VICPA
MGLPRRARDPAELRKRLKPLLEKRRRARINASLSQLKGLILPLLGREELPASSCPMAASTPCDSYREGYRACLARLARVLLACRVLEPAVSTRLLEHLRQRAAGATPNGVSAGDSCGPPARSSPPAPARSPPPAPAPAPLPPAPPCGPGLWRPW